MICCSSAGEDFGGGTGCRELVDDEEGASAGGAFHRGALFTCGALFTGGTDADATSAILAATVTGERPAQPPGGHGASCADGTGGGAGFGEASACRHGASGAGGSAGAFGFGTAADQASWYGETGAAVCQASVAGVGVPGAGAPQSRAIGVPGAGAPQLCATGVPGKTTGMQGDIGTGTSHGSFTTGTGMSHGSQTAVDAAEVADAGAAADAVAGAAALADALAAARLDAINASN